MKGPDNCCDRLFKGYVSLMTCGKKIQSTKKKAKEEPAFEEH